MAQTKAQLVVGLNVNASAPASALQIDASGNINLDSNTLYVDATNNRVGIGTSSPSADYFTSAQLVHLSGANSAAIKFERTSATARKWEIGCTTGGNFDFVDTIASASTPRLRIDTSGNVGIGTLSPSGANLVIDTESNSGSGIRLIGKSANDGSEIDFYADNNSTRLGYIEYNNTSTTLNSETNVPVRFFQNGGEAFRVDTSKRLLVGTSSSALEKLVIKADGGGIQINRNETGNPTSGQALGSIGFKGVVSANSNAAAEVLIQAAADEAHSGSTAGSRLEFHTKPSGTGPGSSPTERMRIGSDGRTNILDASAEGFASRSTSGASSSLNLYAGWHSATTVLNGTAVYVVRTNGNVLNTNGSYTSLSDLKLKENIVDAGSQWSDLKTIKIRNWNFKEETGYETHRQIGPIAQELEQVCPGLVIDAEDRDAEGNNLGTVTKSVNQSVLYMKAVKALQEAMERIETLEAKVAALESA